MSCSKLGFVVSEATVSRTISRRSQPPAQTWGASLANHLPRAAANDFFVVPTATFRSLYVFIVLAHERRRIVHFNVSASPSGLAPRGLTPTSEFPPVGGKSEHPLREFFAFRDGSGGAFLWDAKLTPAVGGKTAEISGMDLVRLRGDQLSRKEVYFDRMALFGDGSK